MNFNEIPEYDGWRAWKTADETWEVKLFKNVSKYEEKSVLHLSEDKNANDAQIENGKFYITVESGLHPSMKWIRERKAIEMPSGMDADYVSLNREGNLRETQHNHKHLDRGVELGRMIALTPV